MSKVFMPKGNTHKGLLIAASLLCSLTFFSTAHPAQAQYVGTNSKEAVQNTSASAEKPETKDGAAPQPQTTTNGQTGPKEDNRTTPMLQGASMGYIGVIKADATVIQGVNTAGTVRVMNLANFEAMLNIGANSTEIIGLIWGGLLMFAAFKRAPKTKRARLAILSLALITGALVTPGVINWSVATARDANLFS